MDGSAQTIGNCAHQRGGIRLRVGAPLPPPCCIGTVGSVGMWAVRRRAAGRAGRIPASPRADASLPYTLTMLGFGLGAVVIGRLVDRFGIVAPVIGASLLLGVAFIASGAGAEHLRLCARQLA